MDRKKSCFNVTFQAILLYGGMEGSCQLSESLQGCGNLGIASKTLL